MNGKMLGRLHVEDGAKRVRTFFGGDLVADTIRPRLVWEVPHYPAYYFPRDDVRAERLTANGRERQLPGLGNAHYFTVEAGEKTGVDAAWHYPDSPIPEIHGLVRFDWEAMDSWFEEDEEVHVHPRSPYTRVDILPSSRHVQVMVNGVKVADSHGCRILFETGLPPRFYVPRSDVRMDLLHPSPTTTRCPYKGTASYWSLDVGGSVIEDVVWTYQSPVHESAKIAELVCFWGEKSERVELYVDGERR